RSERTRPPAPFRGRGIARRAPSSASLRRPVSPGACRSVRARMGAASVHQECPESWSFRALLPLAVGRPDGGDLHSHVDPNRAPGDAPPKANAPGHIELVVPGGKLVRQPLAIAPANGGAEITAVNMGELRVEATIPVPHALDILRPEIG